MHHRLDSWLTDRAMIERPTDEETDDETGFPEYGSETIAEDVPCVFDGASTSFVREDTGERVSRPASVVFQTGVDVQEGDHVDIDGHTTTYEVVGVDVGRDHRRGTDLSTECELERID